MNCETCTEQMIAYLKDDLEDKTEVEAHLADCDSCKKELEDLREVLLVIDESKQPAIKSLVNKILLEAVEQKASEVHFVPYQSGQTLVRFRTADVLAPKLCFEAKAHKAVLMRLKSLADIATTTGDRSCQGSFTVQMGPERHCFKASFVSAVAGEVAVLKPIEPYDGPLAVEDFAIEQEKLDQLDAMETGLVIVSSADGRQSTNLTHALISRRDVQTNNIVTVEMGVERLLTGVVQIDAADVGMAERRLIINEVYSLLPDILAVVNVGELLEALVEREYWNDALLFISLAEPCLDHCLEQLPSSVTPLVIEQ